MSYYLAPELLPEEKPVCLGYYLDKLWQEERICQTTCGSSGTFHGQGWIFLHPDRWVGSGERTGRRGDVGSRRGRLLLRQLKGL